MLILSLNCGSSSLKCQLYDFSKKEIISKAAVERIGQSNQSVTISHSDKKVTKDTKELVNHKAAIDYLIKLFISDEFKIIHSIDDIEAVGHRVVHGADIFKGSVLVDDEVVNKIKSISFLAPLHNPANLEGIEVFRNISKKIKNVAIFDTTFHQTMPEQAYQYAIPREWYNNYKVRRYGFHGSSHLYVSKRTARMLNKKPRDCKAIILHIGNGVSITAIKNGLSVDTSMGMTPLEGAIMGTRSGDIDPSIPYFANKTMGLTFDDIDDTLNKKSGLLGITGRFSDRRDIEANANTDKLCKLAMDMEGYRLKKYIGMYMATLNGVDAIAFTAGVGENSPAIRKLAVENLENLGIVLDDEKNSKAFSKTGETVISADNSKVKIFVIPTDEEIVFAEDVVAVLNNQSDNHLDYPYSFV